MFISFEGPEGSGKTTQIKLLTAWLRGRGLSVLATREPGGTAIGDRVRAILLDHAASEMLPQAEALLFLAARAQHVAEVIRPRLAAGDVVLCDRFAHSTIAYQGWGHGLSIERLELITDFAIEGLWPDLVIYLDIDIELGLKRKQQHAEGDAGQWNRMEAKELAFHERVRHGYLQMAAGDRARWLLVDASLAVEEVQSAIQRRVADLELLAPARVSQG
jgi:dTMP kinase